MNRNMISLDDVSTHQFHHSMGEQPRKLMSRKNKKSKTFSHFEQEAEQMDKHRQNYKRSSAKYAARLQLRSNDIMN